MSDDDFVTYKYDPVFIDAIKEFHAQATYCPPSKGTGTRKSCGCFGGTSFAVCEGFKLRFGLLLNQTYERTDTRCIE